jgi:hypothetical protein
MEVPASAPRARSEPAGSEPARSNQSPPPYRAPAHEPSTAWDEPPVLLVPDPIDANASRRRWIRGLAAAAALVGVVAGGKLISGAFSPTHPVLSERDLTSAPQPAPPAAVVSPEESRKGESTLASRDASREAKQTRSARTPAALAVPKRAAAPAQAAPDTETQLADTESSAARDSAIADSLALASQAATDSNAQPALATATDSSPPVGARAGTEAPTSEADAAATRQAAAAALAELDRERRRQRANAATAALPPPARPEPEPESAPRPPTLEQRSQVYMRIGLDEAVKQLGGPVHVIEGMTPELIGLTRTQLIPGTSSSRPVVRVVYLDTRGRLILLDQQRTASGAAAPSSPGGSLRWTIGDVMLYLRGEPSPDVLRSLQARVR